MAKRRADQTFSAGLGSHFTSPLKKRDKKKSNIFVRAPLQDMKRKHLLAKLALLKDPPSTACDASQSFPMAPSDEGMVDGVLEVEDPPQNDHEMVEMANEAHQTRRRIIPDEAGIRLYNKWMELLPHLIDPFLTYIKSSTGSPVVPVNGLHSECAKMCAKTSTHILCLYFDRVVCSPAFSSQMTFFI
jgi:hypothetical protein